MALQQAAGAAVGFSATLAATHDATGMGALSPVSVGRIGGVPDLDGEFDTANFDDLGTSEEIKFADIFRAGGSTFQVALDEDDTGQTAVEAAVGSKGVFAFTLPSGTVYYRNAIVKSFKPTNIVVGGVIMADINLDFEKRTVKVAA